MDRNRLIHITVSIVLTAISIFLFIYSTHILIVRSLVSVDNVVDMLSPFSLSTLVDEDDVNYHQVIADAINQAIATTMEDKEGEYSNLVSTDDVAACIDDAELRSFIGKKAKQYANALFNNRKSVTIDGEELLALSSVANLKSMVNAKIYNLPIEQLTDEDMVDILNRLLEKYNLASIVSTEGAQLTRTVLEHTEWGTSYRKVINAVLGNLALAIIFVIFSCLLMAVNVLHRYENLAVAGIYGIITLLVPAIYLFIEGIAIYAIIAKIASVSITLGDMTIMPSVVGLFLTSCARVVRKVMFRWALWYVLGTIPFVLLVVWYIWDARRIEKLAEEALEHEFD